MMQTKYTRDAIRDAIRAAVEPPYIVIDELVDDAGLDPYITEVATAVGCEIGQTLGVQEPAFTEAADVIFLRGVLLGLRLGEQAQ
jgi:hypothetical protein